MITVTTYMVSWLCTVIMLSESQAEHHVLINEQTDAESQILIYTNPGQGGTTFRGGRMKRAVTLAAKGLAALETLLTGAKKVPTVSKSYRLYKKKGSLETALNDFNSVEPVLTNQHANRPKLGGRGRSRKPLMGTVGDRRLILMPDGDGFSRHSPVLEIRSATDALHDRIVYKMEK